MSRPSPRSPEDVSFAGDIGILFRFFMTDTVNSIVLRWKKKRVYGFDKSRSRGINLGSSTETPAGWIASLVRPARPNGFGLVFPVGWQ